MASTYGDNASIDGTVSGSGDLEAYSIQIFGPGTALEVSGAAHISGAIYSPVDSLPFGHSKTTNTDAGLGNTFTVTLTGSNITTLGNPTNLKDGATYRWIIKQDSQGGADLFYGDKFHFSNGLPPSMVSGANGINILEGISDGTYVYLTSNTAVTGAYVSGSRASRDSHGAYIFDDLKTTSKLAYWYDATDIDTITKDGSNLVATWTDKSGLGRDAAQSNGTEKPTYNDAGMNGYPCVTFNGSDNMMYIGGNTNNTDEKDFEADFVAYFVVCSFTDANDGHIIGVGSTVDNYLESYGQGMYTESGKYGIKSISSSGIALKSAEAINDGDTFILTGIIKANSSYIQSTGVSDGTDTSNSPIPHTAYTQATIGASDGTNDGSPVDFWGGNIGEIIIFTSDATGGLTDAQIRSVEKYLAVKWGLTTSYRSAH